MDEEGISERLDALEKKRAELHERLEQSSSILSDVDARMTALRVGSSSDFVFASDTIDDAPFAVMLKDHRGAFIYANKMAHDALDVPVGCLTGTTDFDWSPAELASEYRTRDLAVADTRLASETIEKSKSLTGKETHWFAHRFLVNSGARPVLAKIAMDVSETLSSHDEQRTAEIAREKIQHMEAIKHEIRQLAERLKIQ